MTLAERVAPFLAYTGNVRGRVQITASFAEGVVLVSETFEPGITDGFRERLHNGAIEQAEIAAREINPEGDLATLTSEIVQAMLLCGADVARGERVA